MVTSIAARIATMREAQQNGSATAVIPDALKTWLHKVELGSQLHFA
jgi:hypothetical protein